MFSGFCIALCTTACAAVVALLHIQFLRIQRVAETLPLHGNPCKPPSSTGLGKGKHKDGGTSRKWVKLEQKQ